MCTGQTIDTAELTRLKVQIDKHVESKDPEPIVDMLKVLSLMVITKHLLSSTKIGVSVNAAKKAFVGTSVEAPAKELVSKWKAIVANENENSARKSSRPKKDVDYNEEKVESAGTSSTQAVSSSDDPSKMMKLKTKIYKKIGEGPLPKRNEHGEYCFLTTQIPP